MSHVGTTPICPSGPAFGAPADGCPGGWPGRDQHPVTLVPAQVTPIPGRYNTPRTAAGGAGLPITLIAALVLAGLLVAILVVVGVGRHRPGKPDPGGNTA
jgi:hypothetical protein